MTLTLDLSSLDDIRTARAAISSDVPNTPLVHAARLAKSLGVADLYLKLENQQYTGSFKDRGSLNKLKGLTEEEKKRGVIAMSAGNHAQGVAYHAQRLGIPATIVMPQGTPFTKMERTRAFGARVLLEGDGIDSSAQFAKKLAQEENLVFVHPYDDAAIIAGQGTVGLEMIEAQPDIDALIVPIGGGGLIAGIAVAAKALNPAIEIWGVESALYPSMYQATKHMEPHCGGATIAEGIAVKSPGKLTQALIERHVKDIVLVDEDMLERAVYMLAVQQRVVAEGAGAAGVAALLAHPEKFKNRKIGTIICGGNIDARMLALVLMRGLVREGQVVTLRVEINDSPGVLGRVAGVVGELGGNIIEIYHQRMFFDLPVKRADIDVVVEIRNARHAEEIAQALKAAGFPTRPLSTQSV
ncbi:MAG TPA: threonine ammonia-lyase [Dongiaceae bacterium]|jgi:threonine dehydratase|nr:threonine ammonia-lyase [Dongiaceae bacterium]